ncbi:28S ribosomal protein S23, mitochondrial isoform X2 [Hemicordylus capensis]|uniref:28S ribosomal protein S23, mitochondrial isoform X2 n=1 Tax=Hemicordylus capensis TaxID=884348 RepID=UPI0023041CE4|nr:28S ribosomal protein S23, mitochondrial isoform X2 [Hemicordylus capensis]
MSGSRLEKLGSVFTRTRDLLRSGAMPESKKPIWYDVYAAFPPLREPLYQDPRPRYGKVQDVVPPILYPEDAIRAKFYAAYGNGPRAFQLSRSNFKSACQRFVEKYTELQKQGEVDDEKLFEETGRALLAEGIILRRIAMGNVAPQEATPRDPALGMPLGSVLQEMHGSLQEPESTGAQREVEGEKDDS